MVAAESDPAARFTSQVAPFLKTFCSDCHGDESPEADLSVADLSDEVSRGEELQRWEKIHEMLSLGLMPPPESEQPSRAESGRVVEWITAELTKIGRAPDPLRLQMPQFGNRVRHEDLFSGQQKGPAFSYSRLWRISPSIYAQMAADNGIVRHTSSAGLADSLADALASIDGDGFQDFALLRADEGTLRTLVTSSRAIAIRMAAGKAVTRRRDRDKKSGVDRSKRVFRSLQMLDAEEASDDELAEALEQAFRRLMQRRPTAEERRRYGNFLRRSVDTGGPMAGFQNLLMALLMSPEFIFRMELGLGEKLPDGRRMLAPRELAYALAYALDDRPPDDALLQAAATGRLKTRADVEREVRRVMRKFDDVHTYFTVPMQRLGSKSAPYNARPLRFFREFFEYHKAPSVFKDEEHSKGRSHRADWLVEDADRFVLEILDRDRDVFRELLTSDAYFAAYAPPRLVEREINRSLRTKRKLIIPEVQARLDRGEKPVPNRYRGYIRAYNLNGATWSWATEQPFALPHRAGMLTHPAWLVAHSGNFDNDPIRRGKWIRERLLAGNVPDLPIGVEAKLPEDPHATLLERMEVMKVDDCWRCHRQMNPLGTPFEEYDDFGSFRKEIVLIKEQRKRDRVIVAEVARSVDARGELVGTGSAELDGPVDGAFDLIDRLAKSERVRQSIIRHVFRYWMGRNEMLSDSPTLMAMDRAYLDSGGSLDELLVTLLTSDSFLFRRDRPN
ncbi:MAG: DUF1588 domain-containing protein [Pirellulaceae bacterium]|nr:DUF1588 domain-containing protein [Pirellulaceae bacterium]